MKVLSVQDIKNHFDYCKSEGFPIGEQEEILLNCLYKKIEKYKKEAESLKRINNIKYEVENSFIHYHTKETLYRVKVTYPSGGVCYQVLNKEELSLYKFGEW